MAGCLFKDGRCADCHKISSCSLAEVRDHVPQSHTIDDHLVAAGDTNMGGYRLKDLVDPTESQDIATKAYVDGIVTPTPASIPMIAWPESTFGSVGVLQTRYQIYQDLGINAIMHYRHQDDYKNDPAAMAKYDQVYTVAADYGIKVYFYVDNRADYTNPNNGQTFVGRYKGFAACAGWLYADEPHCWHDWGGAPGWPETGGHALAKMLYGKIRALDADSVNHPAFAVWDKGFDHLCSPPSGWVSTYSTIYTPGGEILDVGSVDVYPNGNWTTLDYWVDYSYDFPNGDGFGELGKGMIPVIQAFGDGCLSAGNLVTQCERWEARYTVPMIKGIGFYTPAYWLASNANAENVREQIKDVCRKYGWSG